MILLIGLTESSESVLFFITVTIGHQSLSLHFAVSKGSWKITIPQEYICDSFNVKILTVV